MEINVSAQKCKKVKVKWSTICYEGVWGEGGVAPTLS
jgi:hypothetical protein